MRYLMMDNNGKYSFCNEELAEFAVVPIEEYNGLQKALKIVRDRARQQIDKTKADKHGYRLLKCDLKPYKNSAMSKSYDYWHIKKSTPYSCKLTLHEVRYLIEKDLADYYHLLPFGSVKYTKQGVGGDIEYSVSLSDWGKWVEKFRLEGFEKYKNDSNPECAAIVKCIREKGDVILGITNISANPGTGVYEVTYLATGTI